MRKYQLVANILVLQDVLNQYRVTTGIPVGDCDQLSGTVLLEESNEWLTWYCDDLCARLGELGYWQERGL